jgi:hypothetical protein
MTLQAFKYVQFNHENVACISFGAAAFYRYGLFASAEAKNNVAMKMKIPCSTK